MWMGIKSIGIGFLRALSTGGPSGDGILLESSGYVLLETGDFILME